MQVVTVVFQCKIRHVLNMVGLALAVSDRLDDTLYHDSLINLALCVIFMEGKFNREDHSYEFLIKFNRIQYPVE